MPVKKSTNNDTIEAPESDYLYKCQSQLADSGNGLFTAIELYKDETVAVFRGELLTDMEAEERAKAGNDKYFINLLNGSIMDSMNVKCFAKYANDAKGFPNSKFENNTEIALNDNGDVCIKALRYIHPNEELFCSYGKRYWEKHG